MDRSLVAVIALVTGCASITSGQRAETMGSGRYELAVETSYQATLEKDTVLAFPLMGVAGRVGVSDRVDIGGKVSSAGVGVGTRIRLTSGRDVSVALAPSIDWVHARDRGIGFDTVETALPVLTSYRVRDGFELLVSPRIHSSLVEVHWNDVSRVHTLGVGSGFGAAVRMGRVWAIPELGLLWPVVITGLPADEMGGTTTRYGRVIAQLSVSFTIGGKR